MLQITKKMKNTLDREYFFNKVKKLLTERTTHIAMKQALSDQEVWKPLWNKIWEQMKEKNEYFLAVVLTYTLVCHCEQLDAENMLSQALDMPDPEFEMKSFFADREYLRFSEFDL